jgi:hypothetical protein
VTTAQGSGAAVSLTQYGVQTPTSSTVLVVSADRAVAEAALGWIQGGRIVARTLTIGAWQPSIDARDEDAATRFDRTG